LLDIDSVGKRLLSELTQHLLSWSLLAQLLNLAHKGGDHDKSSILRVAVLREPFQARGVKLSNVLLHQSLTNNERGEARFVALIFLGKDILHVGSRFEDAASCLSGVLKLLTV
jgi:predicted GNAT family N-acyltransferase